MLPTSRSSYKWSPWTNIDRWSEPRDMGHPVQPPPRSRGWRAFSKPMSRTGTLKRDSERVPAVQRAKAPVLLRFTGSVSCRSGAADRVLTIATYLPQTARTCGRHGRTEMPPTERDLLGSQGTIPMVPYEGRVTRLSEQTGAGALRRLRAAVKGGRWAGGANP